MSLIEAPGSVEASMEAYLYGLLNYNTCGCIASLKSELQFWMSCHKVTAKNDVHLREDLSY
jgi:hypothetical protein